jgi:hypothetical protein
MKFVINFKILIHYTNFVKVINVNLKTKFDTQNHMHHTFETIILYVL